MDDKIIMNRIRELIKEVSNEVNGINAGVRASIAYLELLKKCNEENYEIIEGDSKDKLREYGLYPWDYNDEGSQVLVCELVESLKPTGPIAKDTYGDEL